MTSNRLIGQMIHWCPFLAADMFSEEAIIHTYLGMYGIKILHFA